MNQPPSGKIVPVFPGCQQMLSSTASWLAANRNYNVPLEGLRLGAS
jgi:hypothetical protein